VLRLLSAVLERDVRLVGAVLVGSVAAGTADEESDLDVLAIIGDEHNPDRVYEDWADEVVRHLPVVHRSRTPFARANRLHAFLLAPSGGEPGVASGGLLEVDLTMVPLGELRARNDRWQVLFDRSHRVAERMTPAAVPASKPLQAQAWLIDAAAFRVLECRKALRRKRAWHAALALHELRDLTLRLACLARFPGAASRVSVHRLIDDLPSDLLAAMAETEAPVSLLALEASLRRATGIMLDEARSFCLEAGVDYPETLARALLVHVSAN
jgi:hypothetical protein